MSNGIRRTRKRVKLSHCENCDEAETIKMIRCDNCDKRYHYHCAGVRTEVGKLGWLCHACKGQKENPKNKVFQVDMAFAKRHDQCKKPKPTDIPIPKINYVSSQSASTMPIHKKNILPSQQKNIKAADCNKQITELSNNLAGLENEIRSKDDRINEQNAILELQQKRIEEISENMADLKFEIRSKNDRINELNAMLEVHQKKNEEMTSNLADLKFEIRSKDDRINELHTTLHAQQKQIEKNSKNLAEIGSKYDRIHKQKSLLDVQQIEQLSNEKPSLQHQCVKDTVHVQYKENEKVDSVTDVGIFLNLMCSSEKELSNFNKTLSNPQVFCGLEDKFCVFGGDLKIFIVGIVNRIMSTDLQAQLSWSGKRTTKPGFVDFTRIVDLIHFCCAKKFDKYDSVAGERIIQKLLQKP